MTNLNKYLHNDTSEKEVTVSVSVNSGSETFHERNTNTRHKPLFLCCFRLCLSKLLTFCYVFCYTFLENKSSSCVTLRMSESCELRSFYSLFSIFTACKGKGKAVPLQAWSVPQGSRKLRFPDFMTTAQNCGKVVSLTHRLTLAQEIHLVVISVRG